MPISRLLGSPKRPCKQLNLKGFLASADDVPGPFEPRRDRLFSTLHRPRRTIAIEFACARVNQIQPNATNRLTLCAFSAAIPAQFVHRPHGGEFFGSSVSGLLAKSCI